jgi:hypothetical protein
VCVCVCVEEREKGEEGKWEHRSDRDKLVGDSDYKLALMNQVRSASRDNEERERVCVCVGKRVRERIREKNSAR